MQCLKDDLALLQPIGYGSFVKITKYNSLENCYTVPQNGIIRVMCDFRPNSRIGVSAVHNGINLGFIIRIVTPTTLLASQIVNSIPVYKGMKIFVQDNACTAEENTNNVWFCPYTY